MFCQALIEFHLNDHILALEIILQATTALHFNVYMVERLVDGGIVNNAVDCRVLADTAGIERFYPKIRYTVVCIGADTKKRRENGYGCS